MGRHRTCARDAFAIWTSGSDFVWAQRAWELLMKVGLCRYQTERERHIVIGQFLALASIYRDWCSVARDETQEDAPGYWIDGIDVHPLYLGQIVADEELSDDPEEALWDALRRLMHAHRSAVLEALRKELGNGDEGLFVFFWQSVNETDASDEDYDPNMDWNRLNEPEPEHLASYQWVQLGCPYTRFALD